VESSRHQHNIETLSDAQPVYKTIFSSALTAESQKLQQPAAQPKSGNSINSGERYSKNQIPILPGKSPTSAKHLHVTAAMGVINFKQTRELEQELN